ncbi:MAG TPA: cytochrome d ubiquinol oxidase subunit II [Anaeromyxobacteraceae bacterium]
MDLNTIWFVLVGVLIAGYAVLDGFDLGVGALSLLARTKEERDLHIAAIAPVWDGNEVWLLTGGGALFAAFPVVYATVFSGFYLALVLLLVALIARAVSMEFRQVIADARWVRAWDWAFGLGSLLPAILLGVAVGNVLRGLPTAADGTFAVTFLGLLNPYAILVGLVSCAFFVMHGALYLRLKVEGELADRMGRYASRAFVAFLALYAAATVATMVVAPYLFQKTGSALFWALSALVAASVGAIPLLRRRSPLGAFVASSATIVFMILVAASSAYPALVPARDPSGAFSLDRTLTIYNASSTPATLTTMLVIALLGMPLVIAYTAVIYRVFKGKVPPGAGYGVAAQPRTRAAA